MQPTRQASPATTWCRAITTSFLLPLLLGVSSTASRGGTFSAFGPETFLRRPGSPAQETREFHLQNPAVPYRIQVYNGGLEGKTHRVSSARIVLNGTTVVGPSDLDQGVGFLERAVELSTDNLLEVTLRSRPGSALAIEIVGEDQEPPGIVASLDPAPNAEGWNRDEVTVSFRCEDATSGMESCSDPVVVAQEGAGQLVTGTARDRAGNEAAITVEVSLDWTPPELWATLEPPPNVRGWNNTDVTVHFEAEDGLSGVAEHSGPVRVTGEGAGLDVTGTAADRAGNGTQASVRVNVDRTPPAVELDAPASVSEGETFVVEVLATDEYGVAAVELYADGLLESFDSSAPYRFELTAPEGVEGVELAATAVDLAGNAAASAPATVSVRRAFAVAVVEPADGQEVVEGSLLDVRAEVRSPAEVLAVEFYVDGELWAEDLSAPYQVSLPVPTGVAQLELSASAIDARGLETRSEGILVFPVPDPLTTVVGLVLDENGEPAAGAWVRVEVPGVERQSYSDLVAEDGSFLIPSVPTIVGDLVAEALFDVPRRPLQAKASAPEPPVPGGLTDVGVLQFLPSVPLAISTFERGAEAWRMAGDGSLYYRSTGGNPGGHLLAVDQRRGSTYFFVAPAKFLGDVSAAYGHSLEFDLRRSAGGTYDTQSEVVLIGDGVSLFYDTSLPGRLWTRYRVLLHETEPGWRLGHRNGPPATAQDLLDALASLRALRIRGEYVTGADHTRLDNVVLYGGVEP